MNLILSDVEETIMIVDQEEGATHSPHTVNASTVFLASSSSFRLHVDFAFRRLSNEKWKCCSYVETGSYWCVLSLMVLFHGR